MLRLLPLLLIARVSSAAPAGFKLTRIAQPTSPSARDPAVFNFTYALPDGSSEHLDCRLDGSLLPPNSSYTWWDQGVTLTLPGLADGMRNISCAMCNGTVVPANGAVCSTPRSVYSWLQLQTAPTATIMTCPGSAPGAPQNTTTASLAFGATCASLPGAACPAQAHVQWDSFCALGSDSTKRTATKTSTTGQDTCTLPADWSKQEVVVHVEAYVKGSTMGRSAAAGASCNFTFEYTPSPEPAPTPAPAPSDSPTDSPTPAPANIPAGSPTPAPAGNAGLSIISGPPLLDTRLADFTNTKVFKYTFVLGGDGATADTAKNYECCIQDSSKTSCIYTECTFPEQTYEKAFRDGTHMFFLRAKSDNSTSSYAFRTLHLTRPSTPTMSSISVSDGTTHSTGISIVLSNNVPAANPPLPAGVMPSDAVLQYRFDGAKTWSAADENFQTTRSITVSKVAGTFSQGNHTFEARTVWKSGSWFNYTSSLAMSGDEVVASRTFAIYAWNVVAGLHVTLDKPAGIDHDCTGSQNPFFGGSAACAGHVYALDSIQLAFHAPNETVSQSFRVEHVGVNEDVPVFPSTCIIGVTGPPENVCASVVLSNLADGFHSLKIIVVDTATNIALTTAPTWANWTVDTQMPTVEIDTASHPVKCDDNQFDSGKCKTHLSTATFGAMSNEDSIFLYAIDPPSGIPPARDSDLWQLAPNQIDPRPGHEGSHMGPPCHSSYAECYGAKKGIQGIHVSVTPGEHMIVVEAMDEAGHTSEAAIYSWQYTPGSGIPGTPRNVAVTAASAAAAKSTTNDGGFSLPVTISWDEPTDDGGSAITNYDIIFQSTNPARSQKFTLATNSGSKSSLTTYVPEGITYRFHVSASNEHGAGSVSQPAVDYRATDPGEPCSSVDCSGHGTCSISGSSVGCLCLPFYSTSGSIRGGYCDEVQELNVRHEGVTMGLFLNTLSNFDWERCFKSSNDDGGNTKEEDVLPCTAAGTQGDAGVQVRSDPEQCSQVYDLTTNGLSFDFRATVTGNSCEERNKGTPKALSESLTTWNAEMRNMAKKGINRACMEKLATSECDGDYLKVAMTIVDEGTIHDHISLMLANPAARVEFEQRLGSEIHLLLDNVRAQQVNVDTIDFGVLVNGKSGEGGATLYGKGEKDLAVVQWRIRPDGNGTDMSRVKASIDALKALPKLANTRWLKAVDTSTLSSEIVKLGEVECSEDDYLCIVTHLAPWQIALIVIGVLVVLIGLFCLVRKCCCNSGGNPYNSGGGGFGKGMSGRSGSASFRGSSGIGGSRRGSSSHSRLHEEADDEVDLLTGSSSSRGVDIEMRGSGFRRNKGKNAFGL